MNIILFDSSEARDNLLPLSFTRPLADFRAGITTIREKWEALLPATYSYMTAEYLSKKFATVDDDDSLYIAGNVCPSYDDGFAETVTSLRPGQALMSNNTLVAFRGSRSQFIDVESHSRVQCKANLNIINNLCDIFLSNGDQIRKDFDFAEKPDAQTLSPSNRLIGPAERLYIAPGAKVEGAIINTTSGPVYIASDAEVMEGSCLRGPVALGAHGAINMGTKVYPDTTIGPWCKVGGELNNVVMFGYSNKAHDGFLGNAVIGEWCNLGAGCVASNLKNDYTLIKLWNYPAHRFLKTGLQFCGLIMADHSKAGINTMFNTATVVGVGCNIHGSGFPRTFIPSFSEGGAAGFSDVVLDKFFAIAERVMARRHCELTETDRKIYAEIANIAETYK